MAQKRRSSSFNTSRIYQDPHTPNRRLILHYGDLTDATNLIRIFHAVQPDEAYDLGAQSHVQVSFEPPKYSTNADAMKQRRGRELLLEPEDERGHCCMYATRNEARADVWDYIKCYFNGRRQHSTLSYASQAHVERQRCV